MQNATIYLQNSLFHTTANHKEVVKEVIKGTAIMHKSAYPC